jgi:hypothetical protein
MIRENNKLLNSPNVLLLFINLQNVMQQYVETHYFNIKSWKRSNYNKGRLQGGTGQDLKLISL